MTTENYIYGIDISKPVTALMVRDALVQCFYEAHCEDSGIDNVEESVNRGYCNSIVKKIFKDVGVNFERPTKEGLVSAITKLSEFSKSFRDPEIIKKHGQEISKLLLMIK